MELLLPGMDGEKRHIAVFSLAFKPFEGGAELAVREIVKRAPRRRFSIFTYRFQEEWAARETDGNATIIRIGKGKKGRYGQRFLKATQYVFGAWRAAERLHRKEPIEMIWAVMAAYAGAAALLFKLRHPRIPLLLTLQEGDTETHILKRVGVLYPIWRSMFRRADYIQAISSYLADLARRHGARAPIEIVPNGVDIELIRTAVERATPTRGEEKILITTSRLVPKNGIDILIKAFAALRPPGAYRLLIVGSGPDEEELERLSERLGVSDRVEFFGHVLPEDIPKYLARADVFIRSSRSEGLGTSFLEAMAAGVPIIGTPVGGIPDFLKDRETGLMTRVNDSADLRSAIEELLAKKTLREKVRKNALSLVMSRYRWEHVADAMEKIFSQIEVPVRVLVATGIFPPDAGGPATYTNFLRARERDIGISLTVCTYRNRGVRLPPGVASISRRWPKGIRHVLFFCMAGWKALHADMLLAADASSAAGFPLAALAKILRKRFVVRVTGDYAWEQSEQRFGVRDSIDDFQKKTYGFNVEMLRRLQKFTVRSAKRIITPSHYLEVMAAGWGVNKDSIVVIPNAVDSSEEITKADARRLLRIELKGTIVVSVGRLVPWKGFEELLGIVPQLAREYSHFKLIIIGDGPLRHALELRIRAKGLEPYVMMTGAIRRDAVYHYLRAADVFVLNTSYEGFSHQIIEAIAAGVPVVTTDAGGNPEVVKAMPGSITLTPQGDIAAMEHAIRETLALKKDETLLRASQQTILRIFSVERMLKSHRELIGNLFL